MEHSKRYMVIFDIWSDRSFSREIMEFDDEQEMTEHIKLINSIYENAKPSYDSQGNEKSWGFVALDFKTEKIIKWSSTKEIYQAYAKQNKLVLKDKFFRGENEIPKDYQWDIGEYEGWLQFRWGDGKNAIGYKEQKINKSKPILVNDEDVQDSLQSDFDKQIIKEKIIKKANKW